MNKKAVIYARVSTTRQAEDGVSVDSQVDGGKKKAAELGADVSKVFIDAGVSGRTSAARQDFRDAIDFCALMKIDYFIVWSTSRFARNKADAAWFKRQLRQAGTAVVYITNDIDVSKDEGWLLEGLFELIDEQHSRTLSKDTRGHMLSNARNGFFNGGRVPYGYVALEEGKRRRLSVLEEEATVVRRIFAECLQGSGAKSLALWLNNSGVRRRGQLWTKNTVNYLLANSVYTGHVTFNRTNSATNAERPIEDWIRVKSHPEIVSDADFAAVQALMAARAPVKEGGSSLSQFLFTGLLRCGVCHQGMQIRTGTGRSGKVYSYYECSASLRGKGCTSRMIGAHEFDVWALDRLIERVLSPEELGRIAKQIDALSGSWAKDRVARRSLLVSQLRDAEGRRRNLFEILEQQGKSTPNLGDLTIRLRELNEQIRDLERGLTELEDASPPQSTVSEAEIEDLSAFVVETIKSGSPKTVREFLGTFVESVEVKPGHAVLNLVPGRLLGGNDPVRSKGKWLPDSVMLRTAVRIELPDRLRKAA